MTRLARQALDGVLFDLDDTILDNRTGLREAWELVARAVTRCHADLDGEAVRQQIARSTRWFWSDPERLGWGRLDLHRSRHTILTHLLEALGRPDPELVADATRLYSAHRDRSLSLLPGATAALERVRGTGVRTGLVTNGAAAVQRAKIDRFGLASFFDVIVIEGEFGAGKPEPKVFEHATTSLGSDPARSLMAGDDFHADVLGALRAGLHAVWVDLEGRASPPAPSPRPHDTVRSIVELADRLGA